MKLFVSAIGTDSGKTLVSALLCHTLGAQYWKPIQAGLPADRDWVSSMCTYPGFHAWPEAYRLTEPMSPHAAAEIDGVSIDLGQLTLPDTKAHLVVEGAGGLLVPLNDHDFVADVPARLNLPVLLVANLYLGSINHTLLSIKELERRQLPVLGIIFNGPANAQSQRIIAQHSPWPVLGHLAPLPAVNPATIALVADQWRESLLPVLLARYKELSQG